MEHEVNESKTNQVVKKKKKCASCNRKVVFDIKCICGKLYCKYHKYPDHECINRQLRQQTILQKTLVKIEQTHNFQKLE